MHKNDAKNHHVPSWKTLFLNGSSNEKPGNQQQENFGKRFRNEKGTNFERLAMNKILENGERTVTLAQAYEQALGTVPSTEVITRWIKKGLKPSRTSDQRVLLEAVVVGQEYRTSVAAVRRFTLATTTLRIEQPAPITTLVGRRAAQEAEREREKLAAMKAEGDRIFKPVRGRKVFPPVTPEELAKLEASAF